MQNFIQQQLQEIESEFKSGTSSKLFLEGRAKQLVLTARHIGDKKLEIKVVDLYVEIMSS